MATQHLLIQLGLDKTTKVIPSLKNVGEKIMFIQELSYVEMISEETNVEGGYTQANAGSNANVSGFSGSVQTSADTNSSSYPGYGYPYYPYSYPYYPYGGGSYSSASTSGSAQVFLGNANCSSGANSSASGYYY
jgi:hypothetical protein